jgi:formate hydrogenlyase transcriptional activator
MATANLLGSSPKWFEIEDTKSANQALHHSERRDHGLPRIIGNSAALQGVLRLVRMVAPTDATVLIQGETGTGKELIAEAIHKGSERANGPFVKVNCAAIPAGLLESELFGHERGAYTGAVTRSIGRFERANRGTLFLDEIGDLPLELQPKILRVIQEKQFERLGSAATIHTDVRVICASHRNLAEMVDEREFRADLFYRLSVFPIELPPLRERREDIPSLVHHFVKVYADRMGKPFTSIAEEFMMGLERYSWPGNIRELQNFIERSVILADGAVLEWLAAGTPAHVRGIRACHIRRGVAFAHPPDSPRNGRGGGWSEWCSQPTGHEADDVSRQDETAGSWSFTKLSRARTCNSVRGVSYRPEAGLLLGRSTTTI